MKAKSSCGATAQVKSRRPGKPKAKPTLSINTRTHPDAAGIDIGSEEFVAAVRIGRCDDTVRTYASFTRCVGVPPFFEPILMRVMVGSGSFSEW
jgi:hypothetical protein